MTRASLGLVACVGVWLAACPDTSGGTDAGPDDVVDAGTLEDAGVLDLTRDPSCPADVAWVGEVIGDVVDESGAPVDNAIAQMCVRTHGGLFLCLQPTPTDTDGSFHIVVADNARCADRATLRILVPQADRGTVYCGVALSLTEASLHLDTPFVMVATAQPTVRPAIGDEGEARTVQFGDGLEIDVTPSALVFPADYERLAARALTTADVPACLLEGAPAFDGLYVFSPESELSQSSFAMRIPNSAGLSNDAQVELWLLGGLSTSLADGTRVQEGVWQQFGTGTVSGPVIDVPAAQGLPSFNWFGFRAAP
jgi:hypothetical protein